MIVLDTNVISEQMRPQPSEVVLNWLGAVDNSAFYISAVTEAELLRGLATMPLGKSKFAKTSLLDEILHQDFAGFILPFESKAAASYAEIFTVRKSIGRPISVLDCMIAAIAKANNRKLATRNVADFAQCGVGIINPWQHV